LIILIILGEEYLLYEHLSINNKSHVFYISRRYKKITSVSTEWPESMRWGFLVERHVRC
jgi:hypothetical protein